MPLTVDPSEVRTLTVDPSQVSTGTPDPGYFHTLLNDLKNLPAGLVAFARHPIDTSKAAIGQMDLQHPENSSGILGLPDVLGREWEAGHHGEALAHLTEFGLPVITKGVGKLAEAAPGAVRAVTETMAKPGVTQIAKGTVETAGAVPLAASGHPILATGVAVRGIDNLRKGMAARQAAQQLADAMGGHPPEFIDDISQGLTGRTFEKLTPSERETVRNIADRVVNPKIESNTAPLDPRTREYYMGSEPPGPQRTMADLIAEENAQPAPGPLNRTPLWAGKVAEPFTVDPAEVQPIPATVTPSGRSSIRGQATVTPEAPPPAAPPQRSLAQTEAAMAQKSPPPVESPQSQFTATGERKSPQLRAVEITNANRSAKAARIAQSLYRQGLEPGDIMEIPMGAVSEAAIRKGATPGWAQIAAELGEKEPSGETVGMIYDMMTRLKNAESPLAKNPQAMSIAEQLRDAMQEPEQSKPGPVAVPNPAPKSRLDAALDLVQAKQHEVTFDVRDLSEPQKQAVIDAAQSRGFDASSDGKHVLVRDMRAETAPAEVTFGKPGTYSGRRQITAKLGDAWDAPGLDIVEESPKSNLYRVENHYYAASTEGEGFPKRTVDVLGRKMSLKDAKQLVRDTLPKAKGTEPGGKLKF